MDLHKAKLDVELSTSSLVSVGLKSKVKQSQARNAACGESALRGVTFATIGALWWGQRTTRLQDIPSVPPSTVTYSPDVTCGTEPKRTCPVKQPLLACSALRSPS